MMIRRMFFSGLVLVVVAATVVAVSPGLRTQVQQKWNTWCGWSEAAREADPVGFASHARRRLDRDLETMRETRQELAGEIGQLSRKIREQQALGDQARQLAEGFRDAYQTASTSAGFPMEVRGAAYTEGEAKSQVSMLLAEAEGHHEAVEQLTNVREEAESRMESLVIRINSTETQLAALSTKRELLRARQLTAEGEQLLAQVDQLMTGNAQMIDGNPVRTVRELLDAPAAKPTKTASQQRVEAFLTGKPVVHMEDPADSAPADSAATPVSIEQKPVKRKESSGSDKTDKPIFQQS